VTEWLLPIRWPPLGLRLQAPRRPHKDINGPQASASRRGSGQGRSQLRRPGMPPCGIDWLFAVRMANFSVSGASLLASRDQQIFQNVYLQELVAEAGSRYGFMESLSTPTVLRLGFSIT